MSDSKDPKETTAPEEAQESEVIDEDLEEELELEEEDAADVDEEDPAVLTPGPDAPAEPYHAIMVVDDEGQTSGELWAHGGRLMLFENKVAAEKVLGALEGGEIKYELRGVSVGHLAALKRLAAKVPLFVVVGITPKGKVEALPLGEHIKQKMKAGSPPPLPKK